MTIPIPETPPDYDKTRIIERPDGFYWQDKQTDETFGPFPTLLAAVEDMERSYESEIEPGETVQEAEAELGLAEWVDPDTGALAEEETPRIEDDKH
ncbi:MAG: hypothetical protein HYU77_02125 [Betaproteobacteria bacterium]|nr:hypothetical protein [Betaproteobacteria bacterium]